MTMPYTFAELQRQGRARPGPQGPMVQPQPNQPGYQPGGGMGGYGPGGGYQPPDAKDDPAKAGGTGYQPAGAGTWAYNMAPPPATPGIQAGGTWQNQQQRPNVQPPAGDRNTPTQPQGPGAESVPFGGGQSTVNPVLPPGYGQGGNGAFPPPGPGGIVGQIQNRWQNYQPYAGFNYNGPGSVQAPQYQGPQAYQPGGFFGQTQSQQGPMAYNPVAGPQAQQAGAFQPQQSAIGQALEGSVLGGLQNPSAYGSQQAGDAYDVLNRRLSQGFDVERQRINEDSARRGTYFSTIPQGRLGDVAIQQAQAQSDLATNLATQQAQQFGQDRNAAISAALGVQQGAFGNQLAGYQANLAGGAQNFQQDLAARAFQGDQQALAVLNSLQRAQFGAGEDQRQFQNQVTGYGLNTQAGQQGFQNQMQTANQQFGNQLAGAQFQAGQNQQGFNNALTGYQTNLGAGGQSFAEQQQLLNSLLGAGQQQFTNQLDTARFNSDQDYRQQQLLLMLLGLGGT